MLEAFKRKRAKRFSVAVLALLIFIPCVNASLGASYGVSVIYTEFNSQAWTEHTFPGNANYTLPWNVEITNKLTYNDTTTTPAAKVDFVNAANKSDLLDLMFNEPTDKKGTVDVYQSYTGSGVKIGSFPYTIDLVATYYFSDDGLVVKNETHTQFEFNFNAWTLHNVSFQGNDDYVATAGIMQLTFNASADYGIAIIYNVMPLLVTLAVISMVMKMFNRMS